MFSQQYHLFSHEFLHRKSTFLPWSCLRRIRIPNITQLPLKNMSVCLYRLLDNELVVVVQEKPWQAGQRQVLQRAQRFGCAHSHVACPTPRPENVFSGLGDQSFSPTSSHSTSVRPPPSQTIGTRYSWTHLGNEKWVNQLFHMGQT